MCVPHRHVDMAPVSRVADPAEPIKPLSRSRSSAVCVFARARR